MFPPIFILPLKVEEPPAKRPKPNRGQGKNWKDEKKKRKRRKERKERERHLEIFRTISILYGAFCLKKNEKGMMEKGRESDKFNDVCSKLRLEK